MPLADDAASNLPDLLAARLKLPLPGEASQAAFQPELSHGRHFHTPPPWARPAAVLLLLYPDLGGWHVPLVLRPGHLVHHAGQIGFPGGAIEAGESPQAAALRELEEELGVPPSQVQLLGQLSPLNLYVSNFMVQPWVGVARQRPDFAPDPGEVAQVIEAPLARLTDTSCRTRLQVQRGLLRFWAPGIALGEYTVWGATAMILGEFLAVLEEINRQVSGQ